MQRIAFFLPNMPSGGAERMRIALARQFLDMDADVDFVLQEKSGVLLDQIPQKARIVCLETRRARHSLFRLAHYLRTTRPNALISSFPHQNITAMAAGLFALRIGTVFVTQHNHLTSEAAGGSERFFRLAYRVLMPFAGGGIAVSQGVADDWARSSAALRSKIRVIYNPARPPDADKLANEPVDDPFFDAGDPIVLGVGRLVEQKAFDVLLDAVAICNETRPVRLAIVGDGDQRENLENQAQRLGMADRLRWVPYVRNPLKYMAHANVFVLTSQFEGFGNVLVEALACGTPVVATDCRDGPAEILNNGKHGKLVGVGEPRELSAAILRTLEEKDVDTEKLKKRSEQFSSDRIARQYLDWVLPKRMAAR